MREMFKTMARRLAQGQELVLVTVVASDGATPRGAGARMLVGSEGRICGTIGGGAVEYRSEHIAAEVLKEKCSGEHDFNLSRQDVQNLGMICGGAVKVYFRYIPAGDEFTLSVCRKAEELFDRGLDIWLIFDIAAGGLMYLYTKEEGFFGSDSVPDWVAEMLSRHPMRKARGEYDFYTEQINSSGRVYIFGCGHVAQQLVPVLSKLGFRCVAMDDRPEFASEKLFPDAEEVKLIDFEHISDFIKVTEEDYCCVMSRGHASDTVIQAQLLRTPACYIGVIGSKAKKAGVFKRLHEEFGIPEEELKRITTPIGLAIKAETPEEIAISIAGEMIQIRAERNER